MLTHSQTHPVAAPATPTVYPPLPPDFDTEVASDMALVFGPLGMHTVRASMIDLESMECEASWSISEHGALVDGAHAPDSVFPTAMATIVHFNQTPAHQTVARKLDSQRWAFAWRVDERRVAVAEACYRAPHIEHSDGETAIVRHICDLGMRAGKFEPAEAVNDQFLAHAGGATEVDIEIEPVDPTPAAPQTGAIAELRSDGSVKAAVAGWAADAAAQPVDCSAAEIADIDAGVDRADAGAGAARQREAAKRGRVAPAARLMLALALVLSGVLAVALLLMADQREASARAESARLQARADATMAQRLSGALLGGDYGELQGELDAFAALQYFHSALVTNSRGRVVAKTGLLPGVRVGDPVPTERWRQGRAALLVPATESATANRLLTFPGGAAVVAPASTARVWALGAGALMALLAAIALLWWRRGTQALAS